MGFDIKRDVISGSKIYVNSPNVSLFEYDSYLTIVVRIYAVVNNA